MKIKIIRLISKICITVFTALFALFMLAGTIMIANEDAVNSVLKVETQVKIDDPNAASKDLEYYKSAFRSVKEVKANGARYAETVASEGMTLLKNENDALPIEKGAKVSLFGSGSAHPLAAANGSVENNITLLEGLEEAGLDVNDELFAWYDENYAKYGWEKAGGSVGARWYNREAKWEQIDSSAKTDKADTAIFVIVRGGGEGRDCAMTGAKNKDTTTSDGTNDNYLQLSEGETDTLKKLKEEKDKGTFEHIMVVLNTANVVECDFIDDPAYGIDSAMWVGSYGEMGAFALGDLLVGNRTPSGKLSDTFFAKHRLNPVNANFGMFVYDEMDFDKCGQYDGRTNTVADGRHAVYQEGIYVGYRYTETRYEDKVMGVEKTGDYDYEEVVAYPFGYGLSYTTFEYSDFDVDYVIATPNTEEKENTYYVSVKVTNTGDYAGKEAVQIYLQKPYTQYDKQNGIEKSAVDLVAFDKTELLQPGESEVLRIGFSKREMACYDSYKERTYILENGNYYITAAKDAHAAVNNILAKKGYSVSDGMTENGNSSLVWNNDGKSLTFGDSKKYSTALATGNEITNQFDNVDLKIYDKDGPNGSLRYMTRSDWQGTVSYGWNEDGTPAKNHVKVVATQKMQEDLTRSYKKPQEVLEKNPGKVTFGSDKTSYSLIDLRAFADDDDDPTNDEPIPYDHPMWEDLIDQIPWNELADLLSHGFRMTYAVPSIGKPQTIEQNGGTGPIVTYDEMASDDVSTSINQGLAVRTNDPDKDESPVVYPCNGIVAATFNLRLIEYYGRQWGEDSLWAGRSGLYGMGGNIHRSAYSGRNFHYYSEDGVLTGKMAAAVAKGMATRGVYPYMKHCFLNDQETFRCGLFTWANEQTIREVYLKAFQIAIEEGGVPTVMTSLNSLGVIFSGEQGFLNNVLRKEFGMTGQAVTDTLGAHNGNFIQALYYGQDFPDGTTSASNFDFAKPDADGNTEYLDYVMAMRESAHRILYTVVHSNAMNNYSSDTRIIKLTPWWKKAVIGMQVGTGVLLGISIALWGTMFAFGIIGERRQRKEA